MSALEAWKQLNATFRIVLAAAVAIVVITVVWRILPKPHVALVAPTAAVESTFHAPPPAPAIAASKVESLPAGKAREYRGRLTVTVRDTVRSPSGPPQIVERHVEVLIPKEDRPPLLRSPDGLAATASYSRIRQPWIRWAPGLLLGASVDQEGRLSPHAGAVLWRALGRVDLGAGVSRRGLGPLAGYEFWREFTIIGQFNPVPFGGAGRVWSAGLSYRF